MPHGRLVGRDEAAREQHVRGAAVAQLHLDGAAAADGLEADAVAGELRRQVVHVGRGGAAAAAAAAASAAVDAGANARASTLAPAGRALWPPAAAAAASREELQKASCFHEVVRGGGVA